MSRLADLIEPEGCDSEWFGIGCRYERARILAVVDDLLDELLGDKDDREERFAYCNSVADIVREIRSQIAPDSCYAPKD